MGVNLSFKPSTNIIRDRSLSGESPIRWEYLRTNGVDILPLLWSWMESLKVLLLFSDSIPRTTDHVSSSSHVQASVTADSRTSKDVGPSNPTKRSTTIHG